MTYSTLSVRRAIDPARRCVKEAQAFYARQAALAGQSYPFDEPRPSIRAPIL
jgi:hypothetical protein